MVDEMRHTLSSEEIRDLAISTLGLGLAFAIWRFGPETGVLMSMVSTEFLGLFVATTAIVAVSYIPHEMAHRVTARSMDAYAEFRMWRPGVVLAVLTSFLGFVFAATGGTSMYTRTGERYGLSVPDLNTQMIGYVSIVGPLMNISLAVLFSFLAASMHGTEIASINMFQLFSLGADINGFLAVFNLLPFYPFDGYKVLRWSSTMWFVAVVLSGLSFLIV